MKYKCIYDLNRECISIPKGMTCSEHCHKAYQQGRRDERERIDELLGKFATEILNLVSNKSESYFLVNGQVVYGMEQENIDKLIYVTLDKFREEQKE